jgi:hypothetical protein
MRFARFCPFVSLLALGLSSGYCSLVMIHHLPPRVLRFYKGGYNAVR